MEVGSLVLIDATFTAAQTLRLQEFAGSAWRGAFGRALKRIVCAMRFRPCGGCALEYACLYPELFASDADVGSRTKHFVLAPQASPRGGIVVAGATFEVRLIVMPKLISGLSYLTRALIEAGEGGLTRDRVEFKLVALKETRVSVDSLWKQSPSPGMTHLFFETPLRLRLQNDLVTPGSLTPLMLANAAARRVALLGLSFPQEIIVRGRAQARALAFAGSRLRWLETSRFSTRQEMRMQFGGIVGEATVDLAEKPDLARLLHAASFLHVGKGASMGFGRIRINHSSAAHPGAPMPPATVHAGES